MPPKISGKESSRWGMGNRVSVSTTELPVVFGRTADHVAIVANVAVVIEFTPGSAWVSGFAYLDANDPLSIDLRCNGFKVWTESGSGTLHYVALGS